MKFTDKLRKLINDPTIDEPCGVDLGGLLPALIALLSEIELEDEEEQDKYIDWVQECREQICKITGKHYWEFDQCCYFGHKYCITCHLPQYPELRKLSCSEAREKYGKITEEQYLEIRDEPI